MPQPNTQLNKVIYAISTMNTLLLACLLDPSKSYGTYPYRQFLSRMNEIFSELTEAGDTALLMTAGQCGLNDCHFGTKGIVFVGNHSKIGMNIVFKEIDGQVSHLTDCSEFILEKEGIKMIKRISIHKFNINNLLK
jgi:hypothetical protein